MIAAVRIVTPLPAALRAPASSRRLGGVGMFWFLSPHTAPNTSLRA